MLARRAALRPSRFCVYVDHPQGVDHALCERVTDVLRDYLREYTIDVSSPGIERPLRKPAHFRNAVGRDGQRCARREVGGEAVPRRGRRRRRARRHRSQTGDDAVDIPYDAIVRGNLIDER